MKAKANELRIGNKIYWLHEESESVLTVDAKMISDIDHYNKNPDDDIYSRGMWWVGISLTPEIVKKCGFVATGRYAIGAGGYITYRLGKIELLHPAAGEPFILAVYEAQLFYLHQLQNLIYALTGKELDVQP